MKHHLFWKTGILGGVGALVLGIGIFLLSSQVTVSPSCVAGAVECNDTPTGNVFQGYADLWLRLVAKECVGGNGPDSCLGPNVAIMAISLFVVGFILGGAIGLRKQKSSRINKNGPVV